MKKPGHLENFPCMQPWIGSLYRDSRYKRLLVVGESHYMPHGSTIHLNPEDWYQRNEGHLGSQGGEKERDYIHTEGVIRGFFEQPRRGHRIFGEIEKQITSILEEGGLTLAPGKRPLHHIAYYNYFMRPAPKEGGSIEGHVEPQDCKISEEVLCWFIQRHQPELVIFVSRFAGEYGESVVCQYGIPCISTPHPGCRWWNWPCPEYGRNSIYEGDPVRPRRGRDLFHDFLKKHRWIPSDNF